MKIKLIFIIFVSIAFYAAVCAKPLTIINATTSPMNVEIFITSYDEPIKMTVYPGSKQAYTMDALVFERMLWSTYGKKDDADAFLLTKYTINVQEKLPTMIHGGVVVLSLGGEYMCDDKSGKRDAVKFGKGDVLPIAAKKG